MVITEPMLFLILVSLLAGCLLLIVYLCYLLRRQIKPVEKLVDLNLEESNSGPLSQRNVVLGTAHSDLHAGDALYYSPNSPNGRHRFVSPRPEGTEDKGDDQ